MRTIGSKLKSCLGLIAMHILFLGMIFGFCCMGIAIWYTLPMSILTCRYVEAKQVDCQLQERMAGVILLREIPIKHLKNAYVKTRNTTQNEEKVTVYTVILVHASGEIKFKDFDTTIVLQDKSTARLTTFSRPLLMNR